MNRFLLLLALIAPWVSWAQDTKVTDLVELTATDDPNDVFLVSDVSAGASKKVKRSTLLTIQSGEKITAPGGAQMTFELGGEGDYFQFSEATDSDGGIRLSTGNQGANISVCCGSADVLYLDHPNSGSIIVPYPATMSIQGDLSGWVAGHFRLLGAEAPTSTNPVIAPNSNDEDTGVGQDAADSLALIAGGVWGVDIREASSVVTTSVFGALELPKIESATPSETVACADATVGSIVYVDDTDDGASAALCVCVDTNDGSTFDWVRVDDNATACPHI